MIIERLTADIFFMLFECNIKTVHINDKSCFCTPKTTNTEIFKALLNNTILRNLTKYPKHTHFYEFTCHHHRRRNYI